MNPHFIRYSSFMAGVLLVVSLNSPNVLATGDDASQQKLEPPSLVSLVRGYVEGVSGQSREGLLKAILNHHGANVETVEMAIRAIPHFGEAPVGSQPRRSVMVKGKKASYALYVPPSYDSEQSYPLILCLHGAGFTGESYLERWVPRLEDRYILVCPTISMGAWWTRFGEDLTLAILQSVSAEYHIDQEQIFLTGMSNGGIGAWIIGMHHADLFAGIAPMASGIDHVLFPFVENLTHTPVYVIHGTEDQVMPVRLSRDLVQEMKRHGVPYQYREHQWTHPHAGGHFFPRQELPALVAWFDQQRRVSLPRKISIVRDATHLTPFSWGRIDETEEIAAFSENLVDKRDRFTAGAIYAKLQAEFIRQNMIEVNTFRIRKYTLSLNEKLVDFSQPIVVKTNGVISFEGMVTPSLETLLQEVRQRSETSVLYTAKLSFDLSSSDSFRKSSYE